MVSSKIICVRICVSCVDHLLNRNQSFFLHKKRLATWTEAAYDAITRLGFTFAAQAEGLIAQYEFIKVYAVILAISSVATIVRSQIIIMAGARCAEKLFLDMTNRVIRAPMSYFETTPLGRILNRLTYDVEIVLEIS